MYKTVMLNFTESNARFELEYYTEDEQFMFLLSDYVVDEDNSKPYHQVMKQDKKVEVYLELHEVKELIRTLQSLVPEEGE